MRAAQRFLAGFAAVALASAPIMAAPSDGTVTRRTTLLVHDLEASIAFYRTIGFEKWYESEGGTVTGQGLPVEGAKIGDPSKLVIMKGKDPYIGMIGLLQYGPKRRLPKRTGKIRTGDAILMIEMSGMAAALERMKTAGFKIHKEPETSHIKSVNGEWDAKFMFVFDPDGHLLELTERLN